MDGFAESERRLEHFVLLALIAVHCSLDTFLGFFWGAFPLGLRDCSWFFCLDGIKVGSWCAVSASCSLWAFLPDLRHIGSIDSYGLTSFNTAALSSCIDKNNVIAVDGSPWVAGPFHLQWGPSVSYVWMHLVAHPAAFLIHCLGATGASCAGGLVTDSLPVHHDVCRDVRCQCCSLLHTILLSGQYFPCMVLHTRWDCNDASSFDASAWQRGGWELAAGLLSTPGHVPSEPGICLTSELPGPLDFTSTSGIKPLVSAPLDGKHRGMMVPACRRPLQLFAALSWSYDPGVNPALALASCPFDAIPHVVMASFATDLGKQPWWFLGWFISDGFPLQLAERGYVLHRQILLPTVEPFWNVDLYISCANSWWRLFDAECCRLLTCQPWSLMQASSVVNLKWTQAAAGFHVNSWHGPDIDEIQYDWVHALISYVDDCLKRLCQLWLSWGTSIALHTGMMAVTFLRTLCLVGLCYQGKLLAFALRLKGGLYNNDVLIRLLRMFCSGPPWTCGLVVAAFSPRQSDMITQQRCRRSVRGKVGFSRDCILLVLIMATLLGQASAGSGRFDGQDPTSFRSTRRARKRCGSLIHMRHVARNLDSPTSSESEPDDPSISYFFRIFAVGTWSEVMVREIRVGVGIRLALDILEVDSQVARISPPGHLVPARGDPMQDFVSAVWVPHWTQHVDGAVLLIDASLIGHGLFAIWYPFRFLLLTELASLLNEIWDDGVYVFSLYHSQQHLDANSRFLARDGVTISLQRDPRPQYFHANEFESFSTYRLWGRDMEGQADPPDLEWGNNHVQLTTGDDTLLISVGDMVLDRFSLWRVAIRFSDVQGPLRLQTANAIPERLTFCGAPVRHMIFSGTNLEDSDILVVFLSLRGIGRDGYAATIRDRRFSAEELIAELHLDIPAVPEFRFTFHGGHRHASSWSFRDGDVISFSYIPIEAADSGATSDSSPPAQSEDEDGDEPSDLDSEPDDLSPEACGGSNVDVQERGVSAYNSSGSPSGTTTEFLGCAACECQKDIFYVRVTLFFTEGLHKGLTVDWVVKLLGDALYALLVATAFMWNRAVCDLDVFAEDRQGDTSDFAVILRSRHHCSPHLQSRVGFLPCLLSQGVADWQAGGWKAQGWRLRLFCLAFLLVLDGAGATASTLEPSHAGLCEYSDIILLIYEEEAVFDSTNPPPLRHCQTLVPPWMCAWDDSVDLDHAFVDWQHICTALENGKGLEFRQTCAELGLFLDGLIAEEWQREAPIMREGVTYQISIAEALGAETEDVIAKNSQVGTFQLPPSWLLPPDLFQPWDDFSLLRHPSDFSDCDLHSHTHWALQWACQSHQHPRQGWDLHFYTDGSAFEGGAGWAVVILANHCTNGICELIGCFGGALGGSDDLGVNLIDALQAEQTALCWALLWTLPQIHASLQRFDGLYFCWDCISAGKGASGDCNLAQTALATPLRGLYALVDRLSLGKIVGRHVKSHEGHPWNELADALANSFRKGKRSCGDLCRTAKAFRRVDWAWAPAVIGDGLPQAAETPQGAFWFDTRHTGHVHAPAGLIPLQSPSVASCSHDVVAPQANSFSLKAVSANLQGISGKHRYLEAQFCEAEVDFALLQETKAKGGSFSSAAYHRFATEHEGHWGTAIWIRRFVKLNGCLCAVKPSDCRVLVSEPRLLAISLKIAGSSVLLISAHLPQQSHGHGARVEIFEHLRRSCAKVRHPMAIFLGVDANARVPCGFDSVSGSIEFGEADEFGYEFVQLLSELELWIPATFAECHSGSSGTWRHSSGLESRIDFLCIGRWHAVRDISTWVASDLDLMNHLDDHSAVAVQGVFVDSCSQAQPAHLLRKRYDTAKMRTPEGMALLRGSLADLQAAPWGIDVNSHAAALETATHAVLQKHFSVHPTGPKSAYISEQVWQVRGKRNHLKAVTRFWKEGHKDALLREGFNRLARREESAWWRKVDLLYHLFAAAIRFSTEWIKRHIRKDKMILLQNVADGSHGHSVQDIQRALRRCGLGRRCVGRQGRPLPFLLDEHGQAIASRDDLDRLWLSHFAHIEAGRCVDIQSFENMVTCLGSSADFQVDLDLLPTFIDVEDQFRRVRCGAASGLDGLPPEVFKAAPQLMARLFHPLMVKAALNLVQPVQWRGGILFEAYKHSGSPASVDNYRSLFVSSIPGKCYHRILRNRAADLVEDTLGSLHCGGRKGRPVTLPSFAAQLISRAHKYMRHSLVTFFLDTKSAYYRVVRELAFGSLEEDRAVVALFRRFGVPASDLEQLMTLVHSGGIMATAGMSEHLRMLVQDTHALSWFVTPYTNGKFVALSRAGSRPGESWADLVFAFVYHKVLEDIKKTAIHEGFILQVPFSGERSPFAIGDGATTVQGPLHATWADDSVFFTADSCAESALHKARQLARHVLDQCERHGMEPNLKKGKSAVVLAIRGKNSRAVKRASFADDTSSLEIPMSAERMVKICLEVQYVHLGTILHRDGSMMPEARLRLGVAAAAFKKYDRLIFSNTAIDWAMRRHFFDSLVGGVFFNLALWTPDCRGWEKLENGYAMLLRGLLKANRNDDDFFKLRGKDIPALLDVADLATICRMRRLGFLISLVAVGDDCIWAVLQLEGTWSKQVCNDLRWLWRLVDIDIPFPCASSWHLWSRFILDSPRRFKSLISKAGNRSRQQLRLESLTLRTLRFLGEWEVQHAQKRTVSVVEPFWCGPCGRWFRNKAALASHFFQMHGRVSNYRHVAFGTECQACGKQFRNSQQLSLHLRAKQSCCHALSARGLWQRHVLPGIGSATWNSIMRADLGLKLPTDATHTVEAISTDDHIWEENPDLFMALLGGVDAMLVQDDCESEKKFRLCLHLANFPLYLEEMTFIASRAELVLQELGVHGVDHLELAVRNFFHGEVEQQLVADLSEAALSDTFWRPVAHSRPNREGPWITVADTASCAALCPETTSHVILLHSWDEGDWPPGVSHLPEHATRRPLSAVALRHLLFVMTKSSGWLRASTKFWDSDLSIPFRRFHHAFN